MLKLKYFGFNNKKRVIVVNLYKNVMKMRTFVIETKELIN